MRWVLLWIAVAGSLLAQTPAPPADPKSADQPKDKPAPSCSVSGKVVAAADGTPLKSAHVLLIQQNAGRDRQLYTATTDSSGAFTLKAVVPGRYKFMASRNGYVTQQYQAQGAESGAVLSLQDKQEMREVLFRLTQAAVITGYVVDEDNQPMTDIQITVLRRPNQKDEDDDPYAQRKEDDLTPAGSARTDDRGGYRVYGLKPGEYYIRATETAEPADYRVYVEEEYLLRETMGSEFAAVYYPGVLQRSQAEAVSLRPGEEAQADFSMHHTKTVEVAGRVIGLDGKAATASVNLEEAGESDYFDIYHDSTDSEGKFKIKGVPPGSYILQVYQEASDQVYRQSARQKLQVGNENIDSLIVTVGAGSNFYGHVTLEGSSSPKPHHIYVSLRAIGGDESGYGAMVKPDGNFDVKGVEDGDYAVVVHAPEGWYVKSARLGPDDILSGGLHVEKGSAGTLQMVLSSSGAQLEGSVTEDDKPAVGARVRIAADPETPYDRIRRDNTTTDQNGHFLFTGLAPGKYRVTAKSSESSGTEAAEASPESVSVGEEDHKSVTLKLVPPPKNQ